MIEKALRAALLPVTRPPCPAKFGRALEYAVFSGGNRVRPLLCHAVFQVCQRESGRASPREGALETATAASVAIELLHCASLVHDDLPAFDDAPLRRGLPTVHVEFGEPLAVLVGDALIVRALEVVGEEAAVRGSYRAAEVLIDVTKAVGAPSGICAGQAWEAEDDVDLQAYHRAKTAALFVACAVAGARAGDGDTERWRVFGEKIGEAYQVADDLKDCLLTHAEMGKPSGQDALNDRPNAVRDLGLAGARKRVDVVLGEAIEIAGEGRHSAPVCALIDGLAKKLAAIGVPQRTSARAEGRAEAGSPRAVAPLNIPAE